MHLPVLSFQGNLGFINHQKQCDLLFICLFSVEFESNVSTIYRHCYEEQALGDNSQLRLAEFVKQLKEVSNTSSLSCSVTVLYISTKKMDDIMETLEVTVELNLSIKLFCHEINSFLTHFEIQLKGNKIAFLGGATLGCAQDTCNR